MNAAELIQDLQSRGVTLLVAGNELTIRAPRGVMTPDVLEQLKQHKPDILNSLNSKAELDSWLDLVRQAKTIGDVLAILARFQPLQWTDHQRAMMSHCYHRRLTQLGAEQ